MAAESYDLRELLRQQVGELAGQFTELHGAIIDGRLAVGPEHLASAYANFLPLVESMRVLLAGVPADGGGGASAGGSEPGPAEAPPATGVIH